MKLLTPKQINERQSQKNQTELIRAQEYGQAAESLRKQLLKAEADFSAMLAGQKQRWAREEAEHAKRTASMTREIGLLEEKRQKLMQPIELIEKRAADRLNEAEDILRDAKSKEAHNESIAGLLQDKLDAVGQREQDIQREEQRLENIKSNTEMRETTSQKIRDELNKEMADWGLAKTRIIDGFESRNKELLIKEKNLNDLAYTLSEKEKNLANLKRRLDDERATLQRAFDRLKKK